MEKFEKFYIGERLRTLREDKGLNQRQLADAVGLDVGIINHLEWNRRGATIRHAVKLSEFFGVPLSDFLPEPTPVP